MLIAAGLPLVIAIPVAILFTALLAGYIVWASVSTRDRPSSRTDDYD